MEREPGAVESAEQLNLESVLSAMMTYEEYAEIEEHERPYVFDLQQGPKQLTYVGAGHTSDPKNPLFERIETEFNKAKPEKVFVEGFSSPIDKEDFNKRVMARTREEMIEYIGEPGFTIKLGLEHGIDWYSPEPTDVEQFAYLREQGFTQDEIFAWDLVHWLPQYHRQSKKPGFETYYEHKGERFARDTAWEGFDYSYDRAISIAEQVLGRPIDPENDPDVKDWTDPVPWKHKKDRQTVFNKISAASSLMRDRKIVADIADALKKHDRLFVVYGATHAVMQEPALRKLFAELRA